MYSLQKRAARQPPPAVGLDKVGKGKEKRKEIERKKTGKKKKEGK